MISWDVLAYGLMQRERILKRYQRISSLKIESVSICNANCIFCARQFMTRKGEVMPQELFQDVVVQFEDLGGDAVYLNPVIGDCLCDRMLLKRLEFLRRPNSRITKVVTFSNLIGLERFSESEVHRIFECLDRLIVSIAPNAEVYRQLFRVDKFETVLRQLGRIAALPAALRLGKVIFSGKTVRGGGAVDERLAAILAAFATECRWTDTYFDWGGVIGETKSINIAKQEHLPVSLPCMRIFRPAVFVDGRVGACSCSDYDAHFVLGTVHERPLQEILASSARREFICSFFSGKVSAHCAQCSFYLPYHGGEYE